jgi:predicted DNA-binding ArsR family transcriptional regulator
MLPILELLGLSKEDAKDIPERIKKVTEDFEAIKLLLADNLEINKQILAELKKRGEK